MATLNIEKLSLDSSPKTVPNNALLVEVCWEVARKVGGIYTVVKSKAASTSASYGERYLVVSPYYTGDQLLEFEFMEPKEQWLKNVLSAMATKYHCEVKFGKWLVKGYPNVILVNIDKSSWRLDQFFNDMAGYLPRNDKEVNDAVIFGGLCAWLFCEIQINLGHIQGDTPVTSLIGQFHEWMCGVALILLRKWNVPVATIFTTHATILGRYLSAGKVDFYHMLDRIDIDKEAGNRGVYARHWIEKGSALGAHVFTTVSEITGLEASKLLGRQPDVLVPNGLQVERFEALHEFQNLHAKYKDVINEFVRGHFYGNLDFDLDNTLYFFTSGRYEVFNKGMDVFINALSRLNARLKAENSKITVVAFIITSVKENVNNFNVESLTGQSYIRELRNECDSIVDKIRDILFERVVHGTIPNPSELLTKEDQVKLKSRLAGARRAPLPPVTTHNIIDDSKDEVMLLLKKHELLNKKEDRVKMIYHPEFLSSMNPLIPLDYESFVRGCHLGVFPSYYEPWGYTPAECTVLGVPSVTSNLSGFGNFMYRHVEDAEHHGIYIMDRQFKSPEGGVLICIVNNIVRIDGTNHTFHVEILSINSKTKDRGKTKVGEFNAHKLYKLRNRTEKLSSWLDWQSLGSFYEKARLLAIERLGGK